MTTPERKAASDERESFDLLAYLRSHYQILAAYATLQTVRLTQGQRAKLLDSMTKVTLRVDDMLRADATLQQRCEALTGSITVGQGVIDRQWKELATLRAQLSEAQATIDALRADLSCIRRAARFSLDAMDAFTDPEAHYIEIGRHVPRRLRRALSATDAALAHSTPAQGKEMGK